MPSEPEFDEGMRYRVLVRMREAPGGRTRSEVEVLAAAAKKRAASGNRADKDGWYDELRQDKRDAKQQGWHAEETLNWEFWRLIGKAGYRPEVYFFMLPGAALGGLLMFLQWLSGALAGVPYVAGVVGYFQSVPIPIAVLTSLTGMGVGAWIGWMRAYNKMFYQTIIDDGGKRYVLAAFPLEFLIEHATLTATRDFLLVLPPKRCCFEAGGGDRCDCDYRPLYEEDYLLAKPAASTAGDPEASSRYLYVSLFSMVGRQCTPLPEPETSALLKRAPALALVCGLYVVAFFLLQS